MRNICAVFLKQINETFKNKTILIQFVLFPAFALIMENAIKLQDMPEHFFVKLSPIKVNNIAEKNHLGTGVVEGINLV